MAALVLPKSLKNQGCDKYSDMVGLSFINLSALAHDLTGPQERDS